MAFSIFKHIHQFPNSLWSRYLTRIMAQGNTFIDSGLKSEEFHDVDSPCESSNKVKHGFSLLLQILQLDGKPISSHKMTGKMVHEIVEKITGYSPVGVTVMNDRDVMVEFDEKAAIMDAAGSLHKIIGWDEQQVEVSVWISSRKGILNIVRERELKRLENEIREKEKIERATERVQQDGKLKELVSKFEEQIKKVESLQEDLTVEQSQSNNVRKVTKPVDLPHFSGVEPTPKDEGNYKQWMFQLRDALNTHTEEAVRSGIIRSVRGEA